MAKKGDILTIIARNIDCRYRYTLELPRRGGSNEYPQYVLEQKKNRHTPVNPSFTILKLGINGINCTDMFS